MMENLTSIWPPLADTDPELENRMETYICQLREGEAEEFDYTMSTLNPCDSDLDKECLMDNWWYNNRLTTDCDMLGSVGPRRDTARGKFYGPRSASALLPEHLLSVWQVVEELYDVDATKQMQDSKSEIRQTLREAQILRMDCDKTRSGGLVSLHVLTLDFEFLESLLQARATRERLMDATTLFLFPKQRVITAQGLVGLCCLFRQRVFRQHDVLHWQYIEWKRQRVTPMGSHSAMMAYTVKLGLRKGPSIRGFVKPIWDRREGGWTLALQSFKLRKGSIPHQQTPWFAGIPSDLCWDPMFGLRFVDGNKQCGYKQNDGNDDPNEGIASFQEEHWEKALEVQLSILRSVPDVPCTEDFSSYQTNGWYFGGEDEEWWTATRKDSSSTSAWKFTNWHFVDPNSHQSSASPE